MSDSETSACKECGSRIDASSSSDRCADCDQQFAAYTDSLWGLDQVIEERMRKESLGLCIDCGTGLGDYPTSRLCRDCDINKWSGTTYRRPTRTFDTNSNPYRNLWDAKSGMDTSTYLTPTLGILAERMRSKARHHRRMAARGGPRGRENNAEAHAYFRIASRLQAAYEDVSKYK